MKEESRSMEGKNTCLSLVELCFLGKVLSMNLYNMRSSVINPIIQTYLTDCCLPHPCITQHHNINKVEGNTLVRSLSINNLGLSVR